MRFRIIRISPVRLTSVCFNADGSNNLTRPHQHRCVMASIDQNVGATRRAIELISIRNGYRLNPECEFVKDFERASVCYPIKRQSQNASTQTEDDLPGDSSLIPIDVNTNAVGSDDATKKKELVVPDKTAANSVFWDTLANEPSTSDGSYSQESIRRAIIALEDYNARTTSLMNELAEYYIWLVFQQANFHHQTSMICPLR